jgi:predicted negative regulator of RcsB-dependent stress response
LGEAFVNAKEYSKAESSLMSALKLTRNDNIKAACYFYLGEVYKHKSQTQKAIEYYAKSAKNRSWKQPAEYEIEILKHPDKYTD